MVQAFEVATPYYLKPHRFHQPALGKEHIGTVEQFLRIVRHEYVVAALSFAEE